MSIKEFAQQLNGKEYGYPMFTEKEIQIAKDNGWVIVTGASDDLMEFESALRDEGGCPRMRTEMLSHGRTRLTFHMRHSWCMRMENRIAVGLCFP